MNDNNEQTIEEQEPPLPEKSKKAKEPWTFTQYFWLGAKVILFSHLIIFIFSLAIYFSELSSKTTPNLLDFFTQTIVIDVISLWFGTPILLLFSLVSWAMIRKKEATGLPLGIIACAGTSLILSIILCSVIPMPNVFGHG